MNCNCIPEMEARLAGHYEKALGKVVKVQLSQAWAINDEGITHTITVPFTVQADAPGYRSAKGKTSVFHVSFCPVCGVSTAKPEPVVG